MKKIIILFSLLSVLSCVGYAQDTEEITDQISDTKEVVGAVYEGVKTALADLGEALKVPATHVYEVLIRQAQLEATVNAAAIGSVLTVTISVMLISLFVYNRSSKGHLKMHEADKYYEIPNFFDIAGSVMVLIGGILTALMVIVFVSNLSSIATGLFNPEYYAIKTLLNALN